MRALAHSGRFHERSCPTNFSLWIQDTKSQTEVCAARKGCPLFAGRKLLVVDDSPYYRTVLGLTFNDEGMEVTTAVDSLEALERLAQSTPDVILANVSIPGINGYELCERIKQSEQFGHIPVMLLVGLHELFDQAEARRVGADDVVTKPFKSIRQLVGRVGSLLGGKSADAGEAGYEHSTLGLGRSEDTSAPATDEQVMTEPEVRVFVEAPVMTEHELLEPVIEPTGNVCVADVELQTADTQKLESPVHTAPDEQPADDTNVKVFIEASSMTEHEPIETSVEAPATTCAADVERQTADTQELQRIDDEPPAETKAPISYAPEKTQPAMNDALLDLDGFEAPAQMAASEDLILDLDYEDLTDEPAFATYETVSEPAAFQAAPPAESAESAESIESIASELPSSTHEEQHVAELQEWAIVTEAPPQDTPMTVAPEPEATAPPMALSAADIDAIAHRVVEQLSENVVREIAWEVVPELAELLIRKKLEDK